MPLLTNWLLIANLAGFLAEIALGDGVIRRFALWPVGAGFEVWQLVSCGFLHGGVVHLATNMFGLWMFGRDVERTLGARQFIALYFLSLLLASLSQLAADALMAEAMPTIGASGAVFGVLAAFAMLFPRRRLLLLFPPIPMPAWLFVTLYALFELYAGFTTTLQGIAHFAHIGGLVGGLAVVWRWRSSRSASWRL